ncbi:SDR family oxidoreductase [Amphritea sp. 2_MG-2023]|uniref:SDR family NAD(P)-dependent oxidoreductase n=1 Tax=Amphritea TaxID=515417 RepID=UPI001C06CE65|nr:MULTISPECIES: SDR family oxidoreductase [Amphritea]MBU2964976.1 SDR family oxidoreductase [Amphritea atlantica]MDO6419651.1 SDR family oxidoreductase [Amphritea sp. 2_MG-2023]
MNNLLCVFFRKIRSFFVKTTLIFETLAKIYKYGGVSTYSIAQIEYGNILEGKKILITGGGSGIGYALANKCVTMGASVIITGRDEKKLSEAVLKINNPRLQWLVWDVSDVSITGSRLKSCIELLGGNIDVLVNNAGVIDTTDFLNVSESQWEKVYSTNSKGLFFLTQAVCRFWIDNNKSTKKIINISSQGGFVGATYPYRMSKWDVAGLTMGLGVNLCEKGILVNGIAPGIISTKMQPMTLEQNNNIFSPYNPLKRFALPEEIAELGVFLISDASNFIVGQTIICDGGYSIK